MASSLFAGSSDRYKEDFHYSYPLPSGGRLSVDNSNGSIEVTGWDQDKIEISGTKYAETEELLGRVKIDIAASANEVRIRTLRPEHEHRGSGARYVIRVPRRTNLDDIRSSNGPIRVEDIEGSAHLHTSNGPVNAGRMKGTLEARTSNGAVDLRDIEGAAMIETSNGGVHAEHVHGAFEATTSNGGIHADLEDSQAGHPIRLTTSNGPVDLTLGSSLKDDVHAATSNGGITVRVPSTVGARVRAATSSHDSITTDFDVTVSGRISKSRLDGVIGAGGPVLDLTTSNGPIHLARR